ncbi:MAG: hypothetical protein ACOX87_14800 [Chloroflexota bacterium]|jgi:hypothetical protein
MWRTADVHQPTIQPFGLERLYRTSRIVEVTVLDEGRRVDSFESRSPDVLASALKPIYMHLSHTSRVEFTGVEERQFLFGIIRHRERKPLSSHQAALAFLAGS